MNDIRSDTDGFIVAGLLVILLCWESAAPFIAFFRGRWRQRVRHDVINFVLGIVNATFNAAAATALWLWVAKFAADSSFGLLHWLPWPPLAEQVLAVLLLDLWMYWWHRVCHRVPLLWRFHRVHHSDPQMDVSTAYRFHFGEMVASALARVPVIALLGLSLQNILVFEALMFAVVLFHHANIGLPPSLDRALRRLIVTPFMHKVHHSDLQPETDSNFCSFFSWWDRLFGTYRERADCHTIHFGLQEYDADRDQTFSALCLNPFTRARSNKSVANPDRNRNAPVPNEIDLES